MSPVPVAVELKNLLGYFGIEPEDLEALSRLHIPLERHADELVEAFYQHLGRYPETRRLLEDDAVRMRLAESQRQYLMSLASPVIDDDYVEQRSRIGQAHERVGLDTRWYLGAYALYLTLILPVVYEAVGDDLQVLNRTVSALQKRLLFDAEIAIRQYIERRESELVELNEKLRAEAGSLSEEVKATYKDLRLSQARARQAERLASVATLISGLAHEVGTPMSVIRGHAEALESAVEGERATWRLNMILEQIDRITGIIQALLNMARPQDSMRTAVDLHHAIDTTLSFLTEKLRRRGVEVERQLADLPSVVADPEKMQQVLLNLMINGIDAMPEGGKLTVRLIKDGDEAVLRVSDTGAGMTPEQIGHIFDPFYTTKPAGRGNGLGLVVVEGIVGEHSGRIDVTSTPGKGTTFSVRLPMAVTA
ncbi:MAG: protoglobin domain-containing protein [Myxococcota bacterium]|nr:protoglobin domain-containing protein [Myxococcota bacterium]